MKIYLDSSQISLSETKKDPQNTNKNNNKRRIAGTHMHVWAEPFIPVKG